MRTGDGWRRRRWDAGSVDFRAKAQEEGELGNQSRKHSPRSLEGPESDISLALPMVLPVWKAKTSVSLLIDKREKRSVSRIKLRRLAALTSSMLSIRTFGEDICKIGPPPKGKSAAVDEATLADPVIAGDVKPSTGGLMVAEEASEEAALNA